MPPRTILFRADGNSTIGLGHFTRTLALAEMLRDDFQCLFATICPTDRQRAEMERVCAKSLHLPADDTHYQEFLNHLKGDEIVVLDNYYYPTDYQKAIKAKGCTLVCIDDMHNQSFVADLIINHAPGITPDDYQAPKETRFALGLEYVLLRPLFLQQIAQEREIHQLDTILVCFGGSDPMRLTEKSLKVLTSLKTFRHILVVTGPAYQPTPELSNLLEQDCRMEHLHSLNEQQMLEAMLKSDLALVPSSSVLLELLTVGVGIITGYYVENQREASDRFGQCHLATTLGDLNANFEEKLRTHLQTLSLDETQQSIRHQKRTIKNSKPAFIQLFKSLPS